MKLPKWHQPHGGEKGRRREKVFAMPRKQILNSKKAPNDLNIRESKIVAYLTEQKRCAQTLAENLMGAQNKRLSGIGFWH